MRLSSEDPLGTPRTSVDLQGFMGEHDGDIFMGITIRYHVTFMTYG